MCWPPGHVDDEGGGSLGGVLGVVAGVPPPASGSGSVVLASEDSSVTSVPGWLSRIELQPRSAHAERSTVPSVRVTRRLIESSRRR
jgi:hypothetical protein